MHRHRHKPPRFGGFRGFRRAPVLGGHWRLRQLRQFDFAFQYIEGDKTLRLVVPLPGIDKQSLKVRAKSDMVTISASVKEDLVKYATRPEDSWDIMLREEVVATSSNARYSDGILTVDFDLAVPPETVNVE